MKKSSRKRNLFGVAFFGLAFYSCAAHADVRIGLAGPISGPQASFGDQLKHGVEMAVADVNAHGGVLGQKLVVEIGDDGADPKQGISVANKFVGDQVSWVVGSPLPQFMPKTTS